jgi:ubiquinone/menaquinone biosynthesis C-methylase UbiE
MTSLTHDSPDLAETYDRLSDSQFAGGKRLIGRLEVKPGDRVLDVGCGTGRLARFIASITGPAGVVGIDPLPDRVQVARANSPGLAFEVGTAEDLGAFADASFDVVCMSAVFHWVADKPRALREARRVLKPGGRLGMTTPPKELRGASTTTQVCGPLLGERYANKFNPQGFAVAQVGCSASELATLVIEAQLDLTELHVVRRTQSFARGKDVVDFLQSSSFGNFARLVTDEAQAAFQTDLAAAFDARKGPEGIVVHDHGMLVVAGRR